VLEELGLGDLDALKARVSERLEGNLTVLREIKGIGKKVDVGRYLLGVEPGEGAEVLERAGIGGRLLPIRLRLRITGGGTAKPTEALEVLLGERDLPVRLVREALLAHAGDARVPPHDLAALRKPRRAEAAAVVV
jgi:hypothetical protein